MKLEEKMEAAGITPDEAAERPFPFGRYEGVEMKDCPHVLLRSISSKPLRDNMPLDDRLDILAARSVIADRYRERRSKVKGVGVAEVKQALVPMVCPGCNHSANFNRLRLIRKARLYCVKCGGTMQEVSGVVAE